MNITGSRLIEVKDSLQYAMLFAKTEAETAGFGLLLLEVQKEILIERSNKFLVFTNGLRSGKNYSLYLAMKDIIEKDGEAIISSKFGKQNIIDTFMQYFNIEIVVEEVSENLYKLKFKQ